MVQTNFSVHIWAAYSVACSFTENEAIPLHTLLCSTKSEQQMTSDKLAFTSGTIRHRLSTAVGSWNVIEVKNISNVSQ